MTLFSEGFALGVAFTIASAAGIIVALAWGTEKDYRDDPEHEQTGHGGVNALGSIRASGRVWRTSQS